MASGGSLAEFVDDGLTACPTCDALYRIVDLPPNGKAICRQCRSVLYRRVSHGLARSTALYLAAFLLFVLANVFPLIALQYGDRTEVSLLVSAGIALQNADMAGIGWLVLSTSVLCPLLSLLGMLYLLLPLRFGIRPRRAGLVWRWTRRLDPWSLIGVFMLGLLVSIAKLQDMAVVVPGVAFYALIALLVVSASATVSFDATLVWPRVGPAFPHKPDVMWKNARDAGLTACPSCELLVAVPGPEAPMICPRCGAAVHALQPEKSMTTSWALLATATLLLVPANLYPVMTVSRFGMGEPSTILAGVIHLITDGAWPLGLLVFFASFIVPISKIVILGFLLWQVQFGRNLKQREHTRLYHLVEQVGAWSMIDIFLVGILVALVRMDGLATVTPGIGASFFAAAVVATMLAAHAFDPRLLWLARDTRRAQPA